jgi:hypothetical protein
MTLRLFNRAMSMRLLGMGTAAGACALIALLIAVLSLLWLAPWLWLAWGEHFVGNQVMRILLFINFLQFWCWINFASVKDFLAIQKKGRVRPNPRWSVEVPDSRQLWAAELIEFVASKVSARLRGRLRVRFSFLPGVHYQKARRLFGRKWQISVGFSTLAVLKTEEVYALALERGLAQFRPVTRVHVWFAEFLPRVTFWKAALPPDSGIFSLTRWLVESLVAILRPFPKQLEAWSFLAASQFAPPLTIRAAKEIEARAGFLQGMYANFYCSINKRGMMPPYTEGIARFCRMTGAMASPFAFEEIEGLWVYERQFLENTYGRALISQLRLVNWDDLRGEVDVASWRADAAHIRPTLDGLRVADIPKIIDDWRVMFKRWMTAAHKAPTVTPDRQRAVFVRLLAAVFAEVLFDSGWGIASRFGEEVCLERKTESLRPFRLVHEVASGGVSGSEFLETCRRSGVADLLLGLTQRTAAGAGD